MKTIVIVNSSVPVPYRRVSKSIFEILDHLGILYEIWDLSWVRVAEQELKDISLFIIGQEGIGKTLGEEEFNAILKKVSQGMGLVIFDGYLKGYLPGFLENIGIETFDEEKSNLIKILPDDWLSKLSAKTEILVKQPIVCYPLKKLPKTLSPFLVNESNLPIGIITQFGKGKIVLFSISAGIWQDEYLGHTAGLDGIFWRALVWAAKKPFIMKGIPPFVTARIDDVSASGSPVAKNKETVEKFQYLEIMNKYNFIPNLGLFIDDIQKQDGEIIKEKYFSGKAEFSPHAFSDPKNINEFPIYMKHNGEEFSTEILMENFEKVDRKFANWSIKVSETVNAHFGEIGIKSLPFLKERHQRYLMNIIRVGKPFSDKKAHQWELKPYGKINFSLDYIPEDKEIFNVMSLPGGEFSSDKPDFDFLYGCTSFWNENSHTDIKKAIERGIYQIKMGLENMFFGCLTTHEQRISHIKLEDWEEIIKGIYFELKQNQHLFKSYDYISNYVENRTHYQFVNAEYKKDEMVISVKGKNKMTQFFYIFTEENGIVKQSFLEIPPFEKFVILNFKV